MTTLHEQLSTELQKNKYILFQISDVIPRSREEDPQYSDNLLTAAKAQGLIPVLVEIPTYPIITWGMWHQTIAEPTEERNKLFYEAVEKHLKTHGEKSLFVIETARNPEYHFHDLMNLAKDKQVPVVIYVADSNISTCKITGFDSLESLESAFNNSNVLENIKSMRDTGQSAKKTLKK